MFQNRYLWPAFVLATILFYFAPLFSSSATIHWDLVDVAYPAQKYAAQMFAAGKLPHWSPYLYSGTPFLSDPRTGAWYPLHWPFFLIGVTPRAMAWELALHAFLALSGAYLLAKRLFGGPAAALAGAMFYAWGGYFAGHSSLLSKFEAAALLPWLLWAALEAAAALQTDSQAGLGSPAQAWTPAPHHFVVLGGIVGGLIVLAGDMASIVFSFIALLLVAVTVRGAWKPVAPIVIIAALIGSVVLVPWAMLTREAAGPTGSGTVLPFKGLAAILSADYWGVITGLYKGPEDMRQFYLYQGLLLAPMFLAGLFRREKLWLILGLIAIPAAFAFGAYRTTVTDPLDFWFVAALGLALAAASGAVFITEQMKNPYLWILLIVLIAADLWHWNMYRNPLVYARASFAELYGNRQERFEQALKSVKDRPFHRLWSSTLTSGLGPVNSPLITRTEVSYGSGLTELGRYAAYIEAVQGNAKLLSDLAITHGIDTQRGTIVTNPAPLERVTAPLHIEFVADEEAAHRALKTLDPQQGAVVESAPRSIAPQGANLHITNYDGASYRIATEAPSEFLLKLAVPYHPGWMASIDGMPTEVKPVNEALSGVFVPAGSHRVEFHFSPPGFRVAAAFSFAGLAICACLLIFPSLFNFLVR
jgi:hypothetical protein